MSTLHVRRKALRGTKRTCQACEIRFYDLGRSRIVCPICGAGYTPPAGPAVPAATARAAPFTSKTGWRRQPLKRLRPGPPLGGAMPSDRLATAAADEEIEEAATVDAEPNGVLDEQDDTDAASLVDHTESHENEPH